MQPRRSRLVEFAQTFPLDDSLSLAAPARERAELARGQIMSRVARDFSWHLFALALVVAGLSVLAPVTWWQARQPRHRVRPERPHSAGASWPVARSFTDEPQVARWPLIADQIGLDPQLAKRRRCPRRDPAKKSVERRRGRDAPGPTLVRRTAGLPEPKELETRQPLGAPVPARLRFPAGAPLQHAFARPMR
jgi:hypothetical protein